MTSSLYATLRCCEREAIATLRQSLPAPWRAQVRTGRPPRGTLVVWLTLHVGQATSVACLDHVCLLHAAYGSPDLPVELVTRDMIERVAQDYFKRFTLAIGAQATSVDRVEVTDVARLDDAATFLCVHSDAGSLYLLDGHVLSLLPPPVSPPQVQGWATLPFQATLILGYSTLSARELAQLAAGDVLRVQHDDRVLAVAGQPLFHFFYDGQTVMIEEPFDVHEAASAPASNRLADATVSGLPVELRIVLAHKTIPLAELTGLASGDVLTLPHAAFEHVSIFAGQALVAQGELVRLGEGLAVEIAAVHAHGTT